MVINYLHILFYWFVYFLIQGVTTLKMSSNFWKNSIPFLWFRLANEVVIYKLPNAVVSLSL